MTHLSDELLSAHIDGDDLWSPDAAHLDECDECRSRLAALRGVVAAVAAPTPPPAAHVREAAVAAAMAGTTAAGSNVRRLGTRRERAAQARTAGRMSTASAAAALIVALGVGGWAISQVGNKGADTASSTNAAAGALKDDAFQTESQTESATAGGAADAVSGGQNLDSGGGATLSSPAPAYNAGPIGEFTDVNAVAQKANDDLSKPATERSAQPLASESAPCRNDDNASVKWQASLTYGGEAAWAQVVDFGDAKWLLQVLRQTDCVLLATQAFEPTTPR